MVKIQCEVPKHKKQQNIDTLCWNMGFYVRFSTQDEFYIILFDCNQKYLEYKHSFNIFLFRLMKSLGEILYLFWAAYFNTTVHNYTVSIC